MKNNLKKIFSIFLIVLLIGLFSSCNYTKNENKNKNKIEKTSLGQKEEVKAIKKQGKIKDANISENGAGSAQGGKVINKNPLGL